MKDAPPLRMRFSISVIPIFVIPAGPEVLLGVAGQPDLSHRDRHRFRSSCLTGHFVEPRDSGFSHRSELLLQRRQIVLQWGMGRDAKPMNRSTVG